MMIDYGTNWFDGGLEGACRGGHQELIQWMVDLGAKDLNWGLAGACIGGHRDLAQMMIDLGATDLRFFKDYFPDHQ